MQTEDLIQTEHEDETEERTGDVDLLGGRGADFRRRWHDVQNGFVDEPRSSVEQADALVAEVITAIAERFAEERAALESQWTAGEVSTEELRRTLQGYRTFFNRLLDDRRPAEG